MAGPQSSASSYLVQADGVDADGALRTYSIVLDLGPGSMGQLLRHLDPAELDAIAISHCHADHMVDLVGMHVYRRWLPTGALGPVACLGPSELLERLQGVDGVPPSERYATEFGFVTAVPGRSYSVGPLVISPFEALHPVEAYGYRIEGPSEEDPSRRVSLAFTGDTDICQTMSDMAQGVDLLLAEAAFVEGRDTLGGIGGTSGDERCHRTSLIDAFMHDLSIDGFAVGQHQVIIYRRVVLAVRVVDLQRGEPGVHTERASFVRNDRYEAL